MSVKKNDIIPLTIHGLSSDGNGVGRYENQAIFVPATVPGDEIHARIVKDCKSYAFGIVESLDNPAADRINVDCSVAAPCGGCCFRHLSYEAELAAKKDFVESAFSRLGGLTLSISDTLPSPQVDRYRNKAQFPVGKDKDGKCCTGFYANRTHRIVSCDDCKLQPAVFNQIAAFLCEAFDRFSIPPYDETIHTGLIRHIFLRQGAHSGQILLCLVGASKKVPNLKPLMAELLAKFPDIKTILWNINTKNTNVILGQENKVLYGPGYIEDTLCNVPIQLGPMSFYQVNTPAAEMLYQTAAQMAQLKPSDLVLDLYCGMGTIGLSMVDQCKELVGVEIVPEAISAANENAARMGAEIAQRCRFLCADAGQAAQQLSAEGLHPDVVLVDPPRKGCDQNTLDAICDMAPRTIVMISCNPATAARDTRYLAEHGYLPGEVHPVDLFPRTKHVETVVLLSQQKPDDTIEIDLDLDELDATAAETKATYEEIKAYAWDKHHLKVSSLYISQIKRKCGLEVGQNYNLSKSENPKVPKCPPEKEAAIMDALKHFQMI